MCVYIYKTRLAPNEIFSPSNKIHREVGRKQATATEGFCCSYILFIIIIGRILILFMYITRPVSKEIFSPSNKINREVGRARIQTRAQNMSYWL